MLARSYRSLRRSIHCMRAHNEHMDDISRHRYILYIDKYSDLLVVMISVGLAAPITF